MRGWGGVVGIALACALTLSSCSSTTGPLEPTDEPGQVVCTPQDAEGRAVIALSVVSLSGDRDVTVTAVTLVDADGLELIGHDFGAADDDESYSAYARVGGDYDTLGPPDDPVNTLNAGHSYLVKVGLAAAPEGGATDGVEIEYRVDGSNGTRTVQTAATMQVAAAGEVCTG